MLRRKDCKDHFVKIDHGATLKCCAESDQAGTPRWPQRLSDFRAHGILRLFQLCNCALQCLLSSAKRSRLQRDGSNMDDLKTSCIFISPTTVVTVSRCPPLSVLLNDIACCPSTILYISCTSYYQNHISRIKRQKKDKTMELALCIIWIIWMSTVTRWYFRLDTVSILLWLEGEAIYLHILGLDTCV